MSAIFNIRKCHGFLALTAFVLCLFNLTFAQSDARITIRVESPGVPKDMNVFVTGNQPEFGSWSPAYAKLEMVSEGVYERTFSFPAGRRLEFKITLGSWEREALSKGGTVPPNHSLTLTNDTVFTAQVPSWSSGRVIRGKITGTVRYHRAMKGQGIDDRDIIVWLPPSYETNTSKRYPVLYMHDGQNIIDPATSSQGIDWSADEVSDSLIRAGKIKEIIVVGIYNTKDRTPEYSDTEKGKSYMDFVVNSLKPMIDKTYRTLPGRENTANIGSSMGGLIAFMFAWAHPEVFSMAGCFSPAFTVPAFDPTGKGWDYVQNVTAYKGELKPIKVYIDNGSKGVDPILQPGVDKMLTALKEKGYKEGKDVMYFLADGDDHNEAAWAKRLWRPLLFFFGK